MDLKNKFNNQNLNEDQTKNNVEQPLNSSKLEQSPVADGIRDVLGSLKNLPDDLLEQCASTLQFGQTQGTDASQAISESQKIESLWTKLLDKHHPDRDRDSVLPDSIELILEHYKPHVGVSADGQLEAREIREAHSTGLGTMLSIGHHITACDGSKEATLIIDAVLEELGFTDRYTC